MLARSNVGSSAARVRLAWSAFVHLLLVALLWPLSALAAPAVPALSSPVTDQAGILSAGVRGDLERTLLDYQKRITVQELSADGLRALGPTAITLADLEGLDAHGNAVKVRLDALSGPGV